MGIRELKAKYGPQLKSAVAINAAIIAEIPGGAALIDSIRQLRAFLHLHPDSFNARRALADLYKARQPLADEIARRYDLASSRDEQP